MLTMHLLQNIYVKNYLNTILYYKKHVKYVCYLILIEANLYSYTVNVFKRLHTMLELVDGKTTSTYFLLLYVNEPI